MKGSKAVLDTKNNDKLQGSAGNDVLVSLKGDDVMRGGSGDDTYICDRADGNLIIDEAAGEGSHDTLILQMGEYFETPQLQRIGNDLRISLKGKNGSVTLRNVHLNDDSGVDIVKQNMREWNKEALLRAAGWK